MGQKQNNDQNNLHSKILTEDTILQVIWLDPVSNK